MRLSISDRASATLLLAAAAAALVLAATPAGPALIAARDLDLHIGGLGLHLTVEHLISDGLLAVFFLLVAIELRHELTAGDLAHPASAAVPAIAALGGVVAPAGVYLLVAGGTDARGWPVPTATDIAFALGLLALLGRGLPNRVRTFLLALAIIDDLIAILLIAVVFPGALEPGWLVPGVLLIGLVGLIARIGGRGPLRTLLLWVLGLAAWYCVARSGMHATLAGVALGLVLPAGVGASADRALQPVSRLVVLPLFAFSASLIPLAGIRFPSLGLVFLGVALALPVGKLIGILAAGLLANRVLGRRGPSPVQPAELLAVALVGGVGFTVSLLMSQLAFGGTDRSDAGVLGVLAGSVLSILLSSAIVPRLAAAARRRTV